MMMMAFSLDAAVEERWKKEKGGDGAQRWLKLGIEKEKIVERAVGEKTDDPEKDMAALVATMEDPKMPFFAIVRLDSPEHWCQVSYVPDDSMVKIRMKYAACVQHMKKLLGPPVVCAIQASEKSEVAWAGVAQAGKRALGEKEAPDEELMTESERAKAQIARELAAEAREAAAAGGSVRGGPPGMFAMSSSGMAMSGLSGLSGSGVQFPLADSAKERLEAFARGDFSAVAFKIEGKPEKISACDNTKLAPGATIEEVAKTLDVKSDSRYILYRLATPAATSKPKKEEPPPKKEEPPKKDEGDEGADLGIQEKIVTAEDEEEGGAKKEGGGEGEGVGGEKKGEEKGGGARGGYSGGADAAAATGGSEEGKGTVVFVYFISPGTPVKRRMLYASSKTAAAGHARDAGAEPAKILEFDDVDDITSKAVDEALRPAVDAAEAEEERPRAKPKPQGKGPRMLIA